MIRELDQRYIDGLLITLTWDSDLDETFLSVQDDRFPADSFTGLPVPRDRAREAFEHPYNFAPITTGA